MDTFYPFQIARAIPRGQDISFYMGNRKININAKHSTNIWKILEFCNGRNNIIDIVSLTGIQKDIVEKYLSDLKQLGIVTDSRELFKVFHDISNYPSQFNQTNTFAAIDEHRKSQRAPIKTGHILPIVEDRQSVVLKTLKQRRSTRAFTGQELSLDQVGNICQCGYNITHHTCPSGGGLYPLHIYILVEKNQNNLPTGYYEYDPKKGHLIQFEKHIDLEQLKYCFNSSSMPFNSSVQIIIAGELNRQPEKYSNRGYRLTLIEAGHAAQNINLYCTEQHIDTCELGGMLDMPLKKELNLNDDIYPLLGIAIGYRDDNRSKISDSDKLRFAEDFLIGDKKVVKSFSTINFGQNGSFFGATVRYGEDLQLAGATSPSYCEAVFKASVEGYERYQTKTIKKDLHCPAQDLGYAFLDPRAIAPLDHRQLSQCSLTPFTERLAINWVVGRKASDHQIIMVPQDLVAYGKYPSQTSPRICWSSSSGVSAWTDEITATKKALLELIERDAIMRCWFNKAPQSDLADNYWPFHAKKCRDFWSKNKRELRILALRSDYGNVFLTTITSTNYPHFVCGAAACIKGEEIYNACVKAIQEAEYRLAAELRSEKPFLINPTKVLTPLDHGRLYCQKDYAATLSWLFKSTQTDPQIFTSSYDDLFRTLDITLVKIPGPIKKLEVVRVFSPHLIPISFGYWNSYYSHPALNIQSMPELPHFFA